MSDEQRKQLRKLFREIVGEYLAADDFIIMEREPNKKAAYSELAQKVNAWRGQLNTILREQQ